MATADFTQVIYFIGSWVGAVVFFYFVMNFFTKGFITQYLKVRGGRGKKVLIRCRNLVGFYAVVGKMEGDHVIFKIKGEKKVENIITPDKSDLYLYYGVPCLDYDDVSKEIITPNNERVPAVKDPSRLSGLVIRAFQLGQLTAQNKEKIIIILLIVLILGLALLAWRIIALEELVRQIQLVGTV